MKRLNILFCVGLFVLFIASCSEKEDEVVTKQDTQRRMILPTFNLDADTVFINSENDLCRMKDSVANEHEQDLFSKGWEKVGEIDENKPITRGVSFKIDTIYTMIVSVEPTYKAFKARFSKDMVNKINAEVKPELRLSTSKTYLCHWDLIWPGVDLAANETPGVKKSPMCALRPDTKEKYIERGYNGYTHISSDGSRQFQMTSYKLYIICEAVDHYTITLDIDWPFPPKADSGFGTKGYEFIYAIMTKN